MRSRFRVSRRSSASRSSARSSTLSNSSSRSTTSSLSLSAPFVFAVSVVSPFRGSVASRCCALRLASSIFFSAFFRLVARLRAAAKGLDLAAMARFAHTTTATKRAPIVTKPIFQPQVVNTIEMRPSCWYQASSAHRVEATPIPATSNTKMVIVARRGRLENTDFDAGFCPLFRGRGCEGPPKGLRGPAPPPPPLPRPAPKMEPTLDPLKLNFCLFCSLAFLHPFIKALSFPFGARQRPLGQPGVE